MRRFLIITVAFLSLTSGFSQGSHFEDQIWNFNDVAFWRNDTAWFKVRNGTNQNLIFLPTYYEENYAVLFSNRAAGPGETIEIGIVYYTQRKGRFELDVPLYINQRGEPIHFRIKGNIKGFDPAAQLRCPTVNEGPSPEHLEKIFTLEVRDRETEEVLEPDMISVRTRDNRRVDLERSGTEFEMSIVPGAYKISAGKRGYEDYVALVTLEPYQNKFIVYLDKIPEVIPDPVIPDVVAERDSMDRQERRKNRDTDSDTSSKWISGEDPERHTHPDTPVIKPDDGGVLSTSDYRLNNVILIVDVSSSMNRDGKLDNLKSSFAVLVDALRPADIVTVITMSSQATVIQEPTGVYEKDSLKARVNNMKAVGGTNGGAALELAYRMASEHFVEGGNNQVIIATDGVFYGGSLTRAEMEKMISEADGRGIHLSAVAFGNDPKAMSFLQNLVSKGGGSFVQVNHGDESLLLNMIRDQSRKTR